MQPISFHLSQITQKSFRKELDPSSTVLKFDDATNKLVYQIFICDFEKYTDRVKSSEKRTVDNVHINYFVCLSEN